MRVQRIDLFQGSTLEVGTRGNATLTKVIDPQGDIAVKNADQLQNVDAIELRTNGSDVVVREKETLPASVGFDVKMAHYAQYRGKVLVNGEKATVDSYDGRVLQLRGTHGRHTRIDLSAPEHAGVVVVFGRVTPAFVERRTSEVVFTLGNAGGGDALHVQASVQARADISYRLRLIDGNDQHKMSAELAPRVTVQNASAIDFHGNVSVKLNEVDEAAMPGGLESAMPKRMRTAMSSDMSPVGGSSEGATGVKTLPVAAGISVKANSTKEFGFAGALNGTPKDAMDFLMVNVDQRLELTLTAAPAPVTGQGSEQKGSPHATYQMSGTPEGQPAGRYEIRDGADLAGALQTQQYTEKKKVLDIPGSTYSSIESAAIVSTDKIERGTPQPVGDAARDEASEARLPTANRVARTIMERTDTYTMSGAVVLTSKSAFDKDMDVKVRVGSFNAGISDIKAALVDGTTLKVEYKKGEGVLTIKGVPVAAGAEERLTFSFLGQRLQTIDPS